MHFTVDAYMIMLVLCSILLYIRNLENYFFRILTFYCIIISWLVLFSTRILIKFCRGTIEEWYCKFKFEEL